MSVRLRLFGPVEYLREGDAQALQAKRAAVLAYLAVARPGPWHRRDVLCALFWPESDDAHARNALSKAVHYLRNALGPEAVASRGSEELGLARDVLSCDVWDFEAALESQDYGEALALYRGDLLEGLHASTGQDFSHWLDGEQTRLRRAAGDAARALSEAAEIAGELDEAARWTAMELGWFSSDEVALRRLLLLHYRRGNRAEAATTFAAFEERLREEVGVEPSDATRDLMASIQAGSLPSPVVTTEGSRTVQAPTHDPVHRGPDARRRWPRSMRAAVIVLALAAPLAVAYVMGPDAGGAEGIDAAADTRPEDRRVLLTDFEDATGDDLGRVVTESLRMDLGRSPSFALVETVDLRPALARMQVEPGVPLTPGLGLEAAVREGYAAVVEGSVLSAGAGYVLTAGIRRPDDARSLASFRVTADGPDDVIEAIDRLSRAIRGGLGESMTTMAGQPGLARVTTGSLEALKLYTEARRVFIEQDDRRRSRELVGLAVEHDSTFAMAWRFLGVLLQDGSDPERRRDAVAKAAHYRERLPTVERHLVEATYHAVVEPDGERRAAALRNALAVDPDDATALNNLGLMQRMAGNLEAADSLLRRAVRAEPTSTAYWNLFGTRISMGRFDEAAAVLDTLARTFPDYDRLDALRFELDFARGDVHAAASHAKRTLDDRSLPAPRRATAAVLLGHAAHWSGRWQEGVDHYLVAEKILEREDPDLWWQRRRATSYAVALMGQGAWAAHHLRTAMADEAFEKVALPSRRYLDVAWILTNAGEADAARSMLHRWSRDPGGDPYQGAEDRARRLTLYLEAARGDADAADSLVAAWGPECTGTCRLLERAVVYDGLGRHAEAAALYERLDRPGYTGWGLNAPERIRARLRLGPLYEALGDTAKALTAYRVVVEQWPNADGPAADTVRAFQARISTLQR